MATYVLVPAGWAGGWQLKGVGSILQAAGHEVYRTTLTGLGERVHLANPNVGMETHIQDIVNLFEYEMLDNVLLMGDSYGGAVITGVAERIPQHIRHLIYFDAYVPKDGESLGDLLGSTIREMMVAAANAAGQGWSVPYYTLNAGRFTPHPVKSIYYHFTVDNPLAAALPRTFIHCTVRRPEPVYDRALAPIREMAQQAQNDPAWRYRELAADHTNCWETHPQEIADLLMEVA